jgi:hypothetical protein
MINRGNLFSIDNAFTVKGGNHTETMEKTIAQVGG